MRVQQRGCRRGRSAPSAPAPPFLTRAPPPQHPVESTLYLSYALFPALFGAHPIACIYIELNLIAAAMIGHSGFEAPASGSFPHFLHHSLTQVNFAENHLPLDLLFGTWAGDETEARASMRARGFAPGTWKDAALEAVGGAEGEPMNKPLHAKKAA